MAKNNNGVETNESSELGYLIQNTFGLILKTFYVRDSNEYNEYAKRYYENEPIIVGKLIDEQMLSRLGELGHCRIYDEAFTDRSLGGRLFGKRYIINKTDKGGNVFSHEELLKAYESVTDSFNKLHVISANRIVGIPVVSFNPKVEEDIGDGVTISIPVRFTTLSLEEINSLNWGVTFFGNESIVKPFKSVAEFNMYCNNFFGDEYGVERLMETKKRIDEVVNKVSNLRTDALKMFNID